MDPETLSQLRLNASSPALLVFRLPYGIGWVEPQRLVNKLRAAGKCHDMINRIICTK